MTALLFEFEPGSPRGQLGNGVDASMAIVLFAAPSMDNRHRLERAVEAPFTDNNGEETHPRGPRPGKLPKPHKQRAPRAPRHHSGARRGWALVSSDCALTHKTYGTGTVVKLRPSVRFTPGDKRNSIYLLEHTQIYRSQPGYLHRGADSEQHPEPRVSTR